VLAFAVIAALLRYFAGVEPVNLYLALGLFYSMQASFYKYKLSTEPGYRIPKCRCAGVANDKTEVVLRSRESATLGIPNSVFGVMVYVALLALVHWHQDVAAMLLAVLAGLGSVYLSYVMVGRIRSLCPICINVAALNMLILLQFVS
jgi:uncharacterized membrane protein